MYNCLDFGLLTRRRIHFCLTGAGPALWEALDVLREEDASFSVLNGPERSGFDALRAGRSRRDTVRICPDGTAEDAEGPLGSVLEDRLADSWAVRRLRKGENA